MLNLFGLIFCLFNLLLYKTQGTEADTCEHPCIDNGICKAKLINTNCYYAFTDIQTTWDGNRLFCSSQNMSMVKLSENITPDIRALQTLASGFGAESYAWLGGRANSLKEWKFVNGVPLGRTHVSGAPMSKDPENQDKCGIFEYSTTTGNQIQFSISAVNCHKKYYFICRFDDWMNTTSTYMSETATNWYDARSRCKQLGGDLFYLKEWKSFDQIADKLKPATANSLFIGLIHRKWQWEDGQDAMLHDLNYGGYYKSRGNCLAMSLRERTWVEADCNENLRTFCTGLPLGENDLMSTVVSQMEQTTEEIIAKEKEIFLSPVVTYIIVATLVTALLISLVGHILRTKRTCRSTKVTSPEGSQESLQMADNVYISIDTAEYHEEIHTGNPSLPNVVPPAPHQSLRAKTPKQICEKSASPLTLRCRCNTGCGNQMSHSTWEILDGSSIQNRALPLTPVENANVRGWKSIEELSLRKSQSEISRPRFQDLTNDGDDDDDDDDDNEAEDTNTKGITINEYMGLSQEVLTEAEGKERERNSIGTSYTLLSGRPGEKANVMGCKSVEELSPRKRQSETSRPRFQDLTFQTSHGLGQVGKDTARNLCMKYEQKIKRRDGHQEQGHTCRDDDVLPRRAPAGSKNENLALTETKQRTRLEFADNPRSEENSNKLKTNDGDDHDDIEAEDTNTKGITKNEYMGLSQEVLTEAEGEESERNSIGTSYTLLDGRLGTTVVNEGRANANTTRIDDDSNIAMSSNDIHPARKVEED